MLITSLKIAAVLITVLLTVFIIVCVEYRIRFNGILKGFFEGANVRIKNKRTFDFYRLYSTMRLNKFSFNFYENALDENTYSLDLLICFKIGVITYSHQFSKIN